MNKPRTLAKRNAAKNLPARRLRTASMIVATDTMMHTVTLKSDGERNRTAAARVAVAMNVITRVIIDAFGSVRSLNKERRAEVNDARICASRSLNREGAMCCMRRIFEVKYT